MIYYSTRDAQRFHWYLIDGDEVRIRDRIPFFIKRMNGLIAYDRLGLYAARFDTSLFVCIAGIIPARQSTVAFKETIIVEHKGDAFCDLQLGLIHLFLRSDWDEDSDVREALSSISIFACTEDVSGLVHVDASKFRSLVLQWKNHSIPRDECVPVNAGVVMNVAVNRNVLCRILTSSPLPKTENGPIAVATTGISKKRIERAGVLWAITDDKHVIGDIFRETDDSGPQLDSCLQRLVDLIRKAIHGFLKRLKEDIQK